MDIVKVVDAAIGRLPTGGHSEGLKAVHRHIVAAIRHFDRGAAGESESFTDAIYRTNQAFEGGLKEAYRVLAGKDPAKLSPFQVETYLEKNKVVRPRALKQLTRYREDYRNPSTHDYRLDFDEDEALLAVVSICAFAKLLVNQIANKLAFDVAASLPTRTENRKIKSSSDLTRYIADLLSEPLGSADLVNMLPDEIDGFINGVLVSHGFTTVARDDFDDPSKLVWDILAKKDEFEVPIEIRPVDWSSLSETVHYIKATAQKEGRPEALLVITTSENGPEFVLYEQALDRERNLFVLSTKALPDHLQTFKADVLDKLSPVEH